MLQEGKTDTVKPVILQVSISNLRYCIRSRKTARRNARLGSIQPGFRVLGAIREPLSPQNPSNDAPEGRPARGGTVRKKPAPRTPNSNNPQHIPVLFFLCPIRHAKIGILAAIRGEPAALFCLTPASA
jgi:hypothetical protein